VKLLFRLPVAAVAWFGLGLQYWVLLTGRGAKGFTGDTLDFLSFFTVAGSLLAALAMTLPWLAPHTAPARFFARPSVRTAIASYIIIIAAVYHFLLRHQWTPRGWQATADMLLHYVLPALYLMDWLLFVPKGSIALRSVLNWLVFPLAYGIYVLVHGQLASFYPYPFVDAGHLGLPRVLLNMAGFAIVMLLVGRLLIGVDRGIGRARQGKS